MNKSVWVDEKQSPYRRRMTLVLSALWRDGVISRSHLARLTGLALPSVTRLVQELKMAGLILEGEKGESSGGRQPQLIRLNPAAGRVIAIDLSGVALRGAVVDANLGFGSVLHHPFRGRQAQVVQEQIIELTRALLAEAGAEGGKVLGIGVSTPGTVDIAQGVIREADNLRLNDFPIGEILGNAFGLPVFLEHDTAAAALAEMQRGVARGASDLVYVTVSIGIGAGIVINQRVLRGSDGMAGELGHVVVERGGQICTCGKHGCLEAVAAVPAMLSSLQSFRYRQVDMLRGEALGGELPTLEALVQAAREGSTVALEIIRRAADYLAMALSMMACIIDIRRMIIGGEVVQMGDLYFDPLRAALEKYQPQGYPIQVVASQLGENAFLIGAAMAALRNCLGENEGNLHR